MPPLTSHGWHSQAPQINIYASNSTILPSFLHMFEKFSLLLRKQNRWRVFWKSVAKIILKLMFTGPCIIVLTEELKNQLDATCYFIVLLIGSTCFGHYYAHHHKLATMMLITTLVVRSWFVVCWMLLESAARTLLQPTRT